MRVLFYQFSNFVNSDLNSAKGKEVLQKKSGNTPAVRSIAQYHNVTMSQYHNFTCPNRSPFSYCTMKALAKPCCFTKSRAAVASSGLK